MKEEESKEQDRTEDEIRENKWGDGKEMDGGTAQITITSISILWGSSNGYLRR